MDTMEGLDVDSPAVDEVMVATDCEMGEEEDSPFLLLPEEVFLHICSFLDVQDIVMSLSRVCKKFYSMLQSDHMWRTWNTARWGRQHALISEEDEPTIWKKKCFQLEKDWKLFHCTFDRHKISSQSIDIDAVLLMNDGNICVAGSRDRKISIYGSVKLRPQLLSSQLAHQGWIWKLKYHNNQLYSASWDQTIKIWDLEGSYSLTQVSLLRFESAALSMDIAKNGVVYGGSFNCVYGFDPRVGSEPIYTIVQCRSPVLTLNLTEYALVSGCENKTLTVFDLRTRQVRQVLKYKNNCYPYSSQLSGKTLCVGDSKGNVRFYQDEDNLLCKKAVVNVGSDKPVSYSKLSVGSLIVTHDNRVKVFLPFKPLKPIKEFLTDDDSTITSMDYCNGSFVFGTAHTIEFLRPVIS